MDFAYGYIQSFSKIKSKFAKINGKKIYLKITTLVPSTIVKS